MTDGETPERPATLPGRPQAGAAAWASTASTEAQRTADEPDAPIADAEQPVAPPADDSAPGQPDVPRSRRTRWLVGGGLGLLALGLTAAFVLPSLLGNGSTRSEAPTLRPYPDEPTPGWSITLQEVWDAAGGAPTDLPPSGYLRGSADHGVAVASGTDTSGAGSTAVAGVDLETGDLTWSRLLDEARSCSKLSAELVMCEGVNPGRERYLLLDLVTGEDRGEVENLIAAQDGLVVSAHHEPGSSTVAVTVRDGSDELWTRQVELSPDEQSLADGPVSPFFATIEDDAIVLQLYGYDGATSTRSSTVLSRADGSERGSFDGMTLERLADAWLVAYDTGYGLRTLDGSAGIPLDPVPRSMFGSDHDGSRIVYSAVTDEIVALEVGSSGSSVWTAQVWAHPLEAGDRGAVVSRTTDDAVLLQVLDYSAGSVIALSPWDGAELWRAPGSLIGTDGERAVVRDVSTTSAYRTTDGSSAWSLETTGAIEIIAGRLFTTDFSTYTILTPDPLTPTTPER